MQHKQVRIGPYLRIGQGQPRVIIYITVVDMPNFEIIIFLVPMKNIFNVSVIYGHDGHLAHVSYHFYKFMSPPSNEGPTNVFDWPSAFREDV